MTHLPTGIVVQCQNERSQLQNKERCLQLLRAKLFEYEKAPPRRGLLFMVVATGFEPVTPAV